MRNKFSKLKYTIAAFPGQVLLPGLLKHLKPLSIGFFGVLIMTMASVLLQHKKIEADIVQRTQLNLEQRGFKRVTVGTSGRDVVLNGEVSGISSRNNAERFALATHGVRVVESNLVLEPFRLPHLRLTRSLDNVLKIEGELPTQRLLNSVVEMVKENVQHTRLVNLILSDPEVTDPDWLDSLQGLAVEASGLQGMEMEVGAGKVTLGGLLKRQSDYNVFLRRVTQFASEDELDVVNKVGIIPKVKIDDLEKVDVDVEVVAEVGEEDQELTDEIDLGVGQETEQEIRTETDESVAESTVEDALKKAEIPSEPIIQSNDELLNPSLDESKIDANSSGDVDKKVNMAAELQETELDNNDAGLNTPSTLLDEDDIIFQDSETESSLNQEINPIESLQSCQAGLDTLLKTYGFTFLSNSDELAVENHTVVEEIASKLDACPTYSVIIQGHTDSRGNHQANQALSLARAVKVSNLLVKIGVDSARLLVEGYGDSKPIADNLTKEGREQNRRIEIHLVSK